MCCTSTWRDEKWLLITLHQEKDFQPGTVMQAWPIIAALWEVEAGRLEEPSLGNLATYQDPVSKREGDGSVLRL